MTEVPPSWAASCWAPGAGAAIVAVRAGVCRAAPAAAAPRDDGAWASGRRLDGARARRSRAPLLAFAGTLGRNAGRGPAGGRRRRSLAGWKRRRRRRPRHRHGRRGQRRSGGWPRESCSPSRWPAAAAPSGCQAPRLAPADPRRRPVSAYATLSTGWDITLKASGSSAATPTSPKPSCRC